MNLKLRTAKNLRCKFSYQAKTIAAIELELLKSENIQGIILDLDNTLISEDDRYVSPQAEAWIKKAQTAGIQFFVLSNGKIRRRVDFWSRRLKIPAISPARKPFPFAFLKAIKQMQLTRKQVIVIGDSRHTDVLGAWLIGCKCIQVATLPHPPRWWERILGKYVQIPYPEGQELWNFIDNFDLR
jgi:hypothetical protein